MTSNWFLGLVTAAAFGAASLLATIPVGAQVVYAPTTGAPVSPYTPVVASMEPRGCPLYGNGQWAFINNVWIWCPPVVSPNGTPVGYGYGSSGYGYGSPGYGYSSPVGYGYGSPGYGYSSPVGYGYGSPGYGYSAPVGYGYGSPGYGYGYGTSSSLTGSPILDMALGFAASSLISSQFQPYGQQAYYPGYGQGYPGYGQGYPWYGQSYPGYGQSYQGYGQGYPGYGYGGGNTYTRNIYRYYYYGNRGGSHAHPPGTMHPYYHPIHNELTWIARDRSRIANLRDQGGNHAQIVQLKQSIERNQDRISRQRAAENRYDGHVATGQNIAHNRPMSVSQNHITASHMTTAHIAASHIDNAPRMTASHMGNAPRMTAPRMENAPRMAAPRRQSDGASGTGGHHRPPA